MPTSSKSWDATEHLELLDVYLWENSFKRFLDYQPGLHENHIVVLTRQGIKAEILEAESKQGQKSDCLRALISLGTRGVFAPDDSPRTDEESVLFEIEATFAAIYIIVKQPADDDIQDFVKFNCVHNVWPFWRQHVFDTLKRASLPQIVVPLFRGRTQKKKRRSVKSKNLDQADTIESSSEV